MKKIKADSCEFCGGKIEHNNILARFRFKSDTIYVQDVPAWVCNHCGEQYFDAPVYKKLETIATHRDRIKRTIDFPLAKFRMAVSH